MRESGHKVPHHSCPLYNHSSETGFRRAAAIHLCKADLVTKMVVEMTSLQGVIGRIYHLKQGGNPAVADAIFEHYLPRFAGDESPKSTPGLIVALADKLDSIAGLFAVGLEPKGNADPFALRRAAIGVVQGLVDNAAATFSLRQALTAVRSSLPVPMSDDAFESALRFIIGRQRAALLEAGHRHDVVEAIINVKGEVPYEAQRFVEQLGWAVKRDDWPTLLASYSRCARIIKSSGVSIKDISAVDINDVEPATLRLTEKLSSLTKPSDINELVALLASAEPLITDFFNKVLVNAEDPELRRMRLSLVNQVVELANGMVDLSKIEGF